MTTAPGAANLRATNRPSTPRALLALAGWLVLTFCAPALGLLGMPGEWYAALHKPPWIRRVDLRPGMDCALHPDGSGGMAGMAPRRLAHSRGPLGLYLFS